MVVLVLVVMGMRKGEIHEEHHRPTGGSSMGGHAYDVETLSGTCGAKKERHSVYRTECSEDETSAHVASRGSHRELGKGNRESIDLGKGNREALDPGEGDRQSTTIQLKMLIPCSGFILDYGF